MIPHPDAKRITEAEYKGEMIYTEDVHDGINEGDGGFYDSIHDLTQRCIDEGVDLPAEVNGCVVQPFRMKADDIMDRVCEDAYDNAQIHEDGRSEITDEAMVALQTYLDEWVKTCGMRKLYVPDVRTIVVVSAESRSYFKKWQADDAAEAAKEDPFAEEDKGR